MSYQTTGTGVYLASKPHSLYTRRVERLAARRQGVLYTPGLTGTALSWADGTEVKAIWEQCAGYRFRLASINEEIEWGNPTIVNKLTQLYIYAVANWGYRRKVHLFGVSGGSAAILNWARLNQDLVASIGLIIPAVDIQDIYDGQRTATVGLPHATYGPQVAYGGVRPPDYNNPADFAEELSGIRIKIWSSSNDPVCLQSTHLAFAARSGAVVADMGAVSHSAIGLQTSEVFSWFRTYGHY